MNPNRPIDIRRLRRAMDESFRADEPFRSDQLMYIQQTLGKHYSRRGAADKIPLNLMEQAVTTYLQRLVAAAPAAMVTTTWPNLKPTALQLRIAIDALVETINLAESLQEAAQDAMYGVGILKVGLTAPGADGFYGAYNQPFVHRVSLDDFYRDGGAKTWKQCQFLGNAFDADYESVMESQDYLPAGKQNLKPSRNRNHGSENANRVSDLGTEQATGENGYRDTVRLREVYLPFEGKLVTISDEDGDAPLAVHDFSGPETGPYRFLSYHKVPDNAMPLPPAASWLDLSMGANALLRKAMRQAEEQKNLIVGDKKDKKDIEEIRDAEDQSYLLLGNPGAAKNVSYGGVDQKTLMMVMQSKDWFTWIAGNLDSIGGLSPQAGTASQEEQMLQQASVRLQFMTDRVYDLAAQVLKDLAQYLFYDPLIQLPLCYQIPGTRYSLPFTWSADMRRGTFLNYQFKVRPYSMRRQSPSSKLQTITGVVQNILVPAQQGMAQQGIGINWRGYIQSVAGLSDSEAEMADLLIDQMPNEAQMAGMQGEAPQKQPANTTRTYERVSRGVATMQGKERTRMAQMMGGADSVQPNEAAQAMG